MSRVEGVVLAAGSGKRFGSEKLLAELQGEPLLHRVLRIALSSRLDRVRVVASAVIAATLDAQRDPRLQILEYESPGQCASLKHGLRAVTGDGAMILLGDMPWLPSKVLDHMLDIWDGRAAVAHCEGVDRHPRLFPRQLFPRFFALDDGERPLAALDGVPLQRVEFARAEWFADVDRPEDLAG